MNQSPDRASERQLLTWLLKGDVSIQYQVHRDLLDSERPDLRDRIATEGWGARFLGCRQKDGHWGQKFYQPKWTSTHYTLLDLKNLSVSPKNSEIRQSVRRVVDTLKGPDGGILPIGAEKKCDVCVNGMFLNYASYFGMKENDLESIVDFLLGERVADGGFNCESNRRECRHSSMHTTISVLEGILEYEKNGYRYRLNELRESVRTGQSFLLEHRLFRSDRTGKTIDKKMLMLSYPSRWRYDILRALDYFQSAGVDYDPRMQDAFDVLRKKRRKDGTWPVQAKHPGQTHFDMEPTGGPSRWNTLRVLRVLRRVFQKPDDGLGVACGTRKMSMNVRRAQLDDIDPIVRYFTQADHGFLIGMGVDPKKIPDPDEFTRFIRDAVSCPPENKKAYYLIWEEDGRPIGHSNINKIAFGLEAYMHLHIWHPDRRRRGLGKGFVSESISRYFETFDLRRLVCEPSAENPAPNRTLWRVGFEFVRQYDTIPGWINSFQTVNRWVLTREKWRQLDHRASRVGI